VHAVAVRSRIRRAPPLLRRRRRPRWTMAKSHPRREVSQRRLANQNRASTRRSEGESQGQAAKLHQQDTDPDGKRQWPAPTAATSQRPEQRALNQQENQVSRESATDPLHARASARLPPQRAWRREGGARRTARRTRCWRDSSRFASWPPAISFRSIDWLRPCSLA